MTSLHRKLTTKYLFVLALWGLLQLTSYFAFTSYFKTTEVDGNLINISGHQRMLSQRVVMLTNERNREPDPNKVQKIQKELNSAIEIMSQTHNKLTSQEFSDAAHREIYFGTQYALDKTVREFISVSKMAGSTHSFTQGRLNLLLNSLDKVVSAYEERSKKHIRIVNYIQLSTLVLGFVVIIFSGFFIFKPMVSEIIDKTRRLFLEHSHVNLLLEVAVIANESKTFDEALEKTLNKVCLHTSWPVGHAYILSNEDPDLLLPTKIWYLKNHEFFGAFKEITEQTPLPKGVGLPGRVFQSREATWIIDVMKDQNFPRNKIAVDIGVHSAFAFPILEHGNIIAVLEFFSEKNIEKDESLLKVISHVGQQLGQVYERESSANEIRELNRSLEQRVANRTQELQTKSDAIAAQQQLIVSASKMAALGEMAGGVAHEINNPLATIKNLSGQIQEIVDDNPLDRSLLKEMAADVEATTNRIAKIVQGLRSFSRNGSDDPYLTVNIHQIIEETLSFCRERMKHHGTNLTVSSFRKDLCLEGHATEISQVLLNLLNNADDAIADLKEKWIKISVVDKGDEVEIQVTDSGHGIPLDVQSKIFQPFFTTKEIGKGTGMGLSISTGIIQSHNGKLILDNHCLNTRFVIQLPKKQETVGIGSAA